MNRRRAHRSTRSLLQFAATAVFCLAWMPLFAQSGESELVEEIGVRLMFIDVEVRDDEGRPRPGLDLDDFSVQLDGRAWPVYSVDDLCSCDTEGAALPIDMNTLEGLEAFAVAQQNAVRFVIYFDFSQLQIGGRLRAIDAARVWLGRNLAPGEEALLAAFSTAAGLVELTGFTSDHDELIAALAAAREDPALIDPFPTTRSSRVVECNQCCDHECRLNDGGCGWCVTDSTCTDCCPICLEHASSEYFHGRRSLTALRRLLVRLQSRPGRKALLVFHENSGLYPGLLYGTDRVPDNVLLLDQVAAEAVLGRSMIHSAYVGQESRSGGSGGNAVNLGANLAQLTGGSYNRGAGELTRVLDDAGRGCACTYRVGIEPPRKPGKKVHRVNVVAAGSPVHTTYPVRFLTDLDRWLRDAEDVLLDPGRAVDLPVSAALVPVSASRSGWNLAVQVALDLDSLLLLPSGGAHTGGWEVGAMLTRGDGARNWEMLGVSRLKLDQPTETGQAVLHQHLFSGLKPGEYRLGAFVRDRTASVFGGGEAILRLPKPGKGGIVGPVMMRSAREHLRAPLPLWTKKKVEEVRVAESQRGPVPLDDAESVNRESLAALTMICPKGKPPEPADVMRYVSRDDAPLFRFGPPELVPAGSCLRVVDEIETWRLDRGRYVYNLRLRGEPSAAAVSTEFQVERPGSDPQTADAGASAPR